MTMQEYLELRAALDEQGYTEFVSHFDVDAHKWGGCDACHNAGHDVETSGAISECGIYRPFTVCRTCGTAEEF